MADGPDAGLAVLDEVAEQLNHLLEMPATRWERSSTIAPRPRARPACRSGATSLHRPLVCGDRVEPPFAGDALE